MTVKRKMVTAVFLDRFNAEHAVEHLHALGYTDQEINVLMADATRRKFYAGDHKNKIEAGTKAAEGLATGGAIGTAVGATIGAIIALGVSLAIPGLGLVIAGPIAAGLAGAGAGAITGGLIGVLVGWGIPEDNARAYEEALKQGGVVVGVVAHTNDEVSRLQKDLKELEGENVYVCNC